MSDMNIAPVKRTRGPNKAKPVVETVKVSGPSYRALKPLHVGGKTYMPGDAVPEAGSWMRVEAWVRSRHLELVEA